MLRRRKPSLFVVASPLLLALSAAILPSAQAAEPPTFDISRVSRDIATLSSDAFEGRAPTTPGETKTVDWLIQRMKDAGLSPGGDRQGKTRRWTQDVKLLRSERTGTPDITLTVAGKTRQLQQNIDITIRSPLNGETALQLRHSPLLFVGYGVTAPERNWDDFKDVDVRGKMLVVLVNDPDFEGGDGDFGGKAMTYYGRWVYKYEEAARRGAAGVLIIHETDPAAYGWATVRSSNGGANFDIVRPDPKAAHTAVEAWIQRDVAADLLRAAGQDLESLKLAARRRDFRPITLDATLDVSLTAKLSTIITRNVVGRLPGTDASAGTILYSAHWDHLGVGLPDAKGDKIYNGARDNASGVAAMLEIARAFTHTPRTRRDLVFIAFGAEERGLLGSDYYADNPLYPLATTAGLINMDNITGDGAARDFTIAGQAKLGLLDMLRAEGEKQGRRFTPDPKPETGGFYRSDHFPLAKRGVPAISFGPGRDLVDGGKERGMQLYQDYVRDRYHQPADEWSADWNMDGMAQNLPLLYATGRALADMRDWPNWSPDSEFRAARDASAAARR